MRDSGRAMSQMTLDGSTRQQKLYDYSIEVLRIAEPPEGYYLATSFGKDSIVAQRLCDEAGVKYDAHHNVTGIDPPELISFGRKYYPNVERNMYPKIKLNGRMVPGSMWRLIEKHNSLPMRHIRYCCEVLKEGHGIGRRCVMGLRAAESNRRKRQVAPIGNRATPRDKFSKGEALRIFDLEEMHRMFDADDISGTMHQCDLKSKLTVSPMYYWEDSDLWDFIRDRGLPYCTLYDEGFKRLGCIGCPNGGKKGKEMDFERWPKFRDMYIRAIERIMKEKGAYKNFISAEDVLEWWINDSKQDKTMNSQISLL